jgi:hypothetical protein
VLSSSHLDILHSWKHATISADFHLKIHPDLELTQTEDHGVQLTLLGYLIDTDHPDRSNSEILKDLLISANDSSSLFKQTSRLSGRWIIILHRRSSTILFSDPTGLRSVYYTDAHMEPFFCASQPGIIADLLDLSYSNEAINEFLNSSYARKDREFWWPSGISLYNRIRHLVPNHYLDLHNRDEKRFWPWEGINPLDIHDAVEQSSIILRNLLEGGAKRFKLALPITAGIDSRTILAASKDVSKDIFYYTLLYYDLNHKSADVQIPRRLLSTVGLQHHILDCSSTMDSDFRAIYMQNVDNAHEAWGHIAFGLSITYPQNRVCVKGSCSEIARCFYYKGGYPRSITGTTLAELNGMNNNRFAILQFEKWLKQSLGSAKDSNIHILDLFYWEHRMGSWQAMSQLEWDIVQEAYTPFNCRDLLTILLAVNIRYRKYPYKLYKYVIFKLWPELLGESINPKPFNNTLRHLLMRIPRLTDTYRLIKRIHSEKNQK